MRAHRPALGSAEEWWLTIFHWPFRFSYSYVERAWTVLFLPVFGSVTWNSYHPASMAGSWSRTSTKLSTLSPLGVFSRKCSMESTSPARSLRDRWATYLTGRSPSGPAISSAMTLPASSSRASSLRSWSVSRPFSSSRGWFNLT